jgi:hypothetical protein
MILIENGGFNFSLIPKKASMTERFLDLYVQIISQHFSAKGQDGKR